MANPSVFFNPPRIDHGQLPVARRLDFGADEAAAAPAPAGPLYRWQGRTVELLDRGPERHYRTRVPGSDEVVAVPRHRVTIRELATEVIHTLIIRASDLVSLPLFGLADDALRRGSPLQEEGGEVAAAPRRVRAAAPAAPLAPLQAMVGEQPRPLDDLDVLSQGEQGEQEGQEGIWEVVVGFGAAADDQMSDVDDEEWFPDDASVGSHPTQGSESPAIDRAATPEGNIGYVVLPPGLVAAGVLPGAAAVWNSAAGAGLLGNTPGSLLQTPGSQAVQA